MADGSKDNLDSSEDCGFSSQNLSTDAEVTTIPRNECTSSEAPSHSFARGTTHEIVLSKSAGLGIAIAGGIDRPGGGAVTVADIIPGGDCHKDGGLHPGDTLLSVNAESLEGVTHEVAKAILTNISLNHDVKNVVLRYMPQLVTGRKNEVQPEEFIRGHPHSNRHPHDKQASTLPLTKAPHMVQGNSRTLPPQWSMDGLVTRALPAYPPKSVFPEPLLHSTPHGGRQNALPGHLSQSHPSLSPVRPGRSSLREASFVTSTPAPAQTQPAQDGGFSIDPALKLKVDKLQEALGYLGLHLTEDDRLKLRNQLHVDPDGMVQYGEFVSVARQLFKLSLDGTNLSTTPTRAHDAVDTAEPLPSTQLVPEMSAVTIPVAELEQLKQERNSAVQEANNYLSILQDNERTFSRAEEELLRVRKDAQAALHESRALKSRVHLAEAAHKEARSMEMDYEDVVRILETEVGQLREILKNRPPINKGKSESTESLRKRLATLGGELRKSEASRKTYEVATERLLKFAESVYDTATGSQNGQQLSIMSESAHRGQNGVYRPPGNLGRHQKRRPVDLAREAKEIIKSVKALIEVEPLPYGWEETFTEDGSRFFTNHVTQTTSWVHPVSNINHSTSAIDTSQDLPD